MELFTQIDDVWAVLRLPKGVYKQTRLYRRRDRVYAPHGAGYVEVRHQQHDGSYTTSCPDVKLVEHDSTRSIFHAKDLGQTTLRYS